MNLQVHLNGGDALLCTGNLKVHIAEEILKALNIDHGHPAAASVMRPQEIPATGALIGTPASINASVEPQMEP